MASAIAALAIAPAGCGKRTVDASQVEQQIEQHLSTATTKATSVSCPEDVKSETGATFTCQAKRRRLGGWREGERHGGRF